MPSHEEKRVLPFSVSEMFAVVGDIEKYPEFVPGCAGLRILERESAGHVETIIAEMIVSFGFIVICRNSINVHDLLYTIIQIPFIQMFTIF